MRTAVARARFWIVMLLLVALHFYVRPRLGNARLAPDFLVGILTDAVAPTSFGAAALAGTVIGFLSGWVKTLFVADNVLITSLFVFAAAWLRDIVQVLASNQLASRALAWQLLAYSPLAALVTAAVALLTLLVFRPWLDLRAA